MPTRNDITGGVIYISSADGKVQQAFEGIKVVHPSCLNDITKKPIYFSISDVPAWAAYEYRDIQSGDLHEFICTGKINKYNMAHILGFKNYNCYSRFIRRRKRRAEQERRRRLKRGY